MGKRSNFAKRKNDAYLTWDKRAILPSCPMSNRRRSCGKYHLVNQLTKRGFTCLDALDIDPTIPLVRRGDATTYELANEGVDYFITNPPWTRDILHKIIFNLCTQRPTWLLFDADWIHTLQAIPHIGYCKKVVSIGRLRWIPNSPYDAVDNCAWYLFDYNHYDGPTFYPRLTKERSKELALVSS